METIVIVIVAALIFGAMGHLANEDSGFLWGFILGPLGIVIAAVSNSPKPKPQPKTPQKKVKSDVQNVLENLRAVKEIIDSGFLTEEEEKELIKQFKEELL